MNIQFLLAGVVLGIFALGFFMPFTNDYSKSLNFINIRVESLLHVLVGALAGALVYPEDLSWEKERKYLYTIRCIVGIVIILAYTIRNWKHVRNLKKNLSGSMFESKSSRMKSWIQT